MHRFLLAALAAAGVTFGFAQVAAAADMPIKAPARVSTVYDWTGFYIGANFGGGSGKEDWNFLPATTSHNVKGVLGGAQIGYNYQIANVVLGVEGDYSAAGIKGDSACPNPAFTCTSKINGVASLTGRVGYAFPAAVLVYAKGGAAWARENFTAISPAFSEDTGNVTTTGWTLGGGLEYGFWGKWSAKVEYNYYDFGTKRYDFRSPAGVVVDRADIKQRLNVVKVGVNYRF